MTRECREIRDLLDSYARGELLVETNHTVLRHLSTCADCAGELDRRQRALALLRESLAVDVDVDHVRRRVVEALDRDQRWWTGAARRWGLAAAVVLLAAAIWFSLRGTPVDAVATRDSAAQHTRCALPFPAGTSYDAARVAKRLQPQFAPLAERLRDAGDGYHLVEAHHCTYEARRYAHFILRNGEATMSLFTEARAGDARPKSESHEQGLRVTAVPTRLHQVFVVVDDRQPASDATIRRLLESASRFMTTLEK